MAGVYKAVHTGSGQVVAIKVLPPSKAKDRRLLARFQREARLAVQAQPPQRRPHLPGRRDQGRPALPRHGVPRRRDARGRAAAAASSCRRPRRSALVYQALLGLQHIHEQGLVHRDLKPANLMLVPARPGRPDTTLHATVKILDIGLGRALFDEGDAERRARTGELTSEGVAAGHAGLHGPGAGPRRPQRRHPRRHLQPGLRPVSRCSTGQPPFPDTHFVRQMVRHATEPPRPAKELNPRAAGRGATAARQTAGEGPGAGFATPGQALEAVLALAPAAPAAACPVPEEPLRKYLTWLETSPQDDEEEPASAPTIMTPPPPAPVPAAPAPALAAARVGAPPAPVRTPMPAAPAPRPAARATPVAAGRAAAAPPSSRPRRRWRPRPRPRPSPRPPCRRWPRPRSRLPGTQPLFRVGPVQVCLRDLIGAGAGVIALLLFEVLIWLMIQLFRG